MDDKTGTDGTRTEMKDRICDRLVYLQLHHNNATIPRLAIDVAAREVEAEVLEIVAGWKQRTSALADSI
jgi:hypothetical protein